MKNILLALTLLPFLALSQTEKGVSPLEGGKGGETGHPEASAGQVYAVVVGISDYQDEGIPDLRFADKDALAFAGFLQSPAGGELDEDHLKVLVDEKATQGQFAAALDWLWEVAGENDKVVIYFSGHGDVERKSITQPGYLLCWDAPSNVYMGGGAFNVRDLNDVVSTISIQNKAKVILITDACRAGKLSGSGIGGAQATAANLAKQYGNEIKILSCQPDEYSIEGEQWGGGRGAFSYHLLDGLYGMADGNDDLSINLLEIGRYLEDHVSREVAPQSQIPMTVGSRGEKLTTIFPEILEQLKEGKRGQMQLFNATESRGIEDDVLAVADTNIVEMYLAFQKSLEDKQFLQPATACADLYYEQLLKEPKLERLHASMTRHYAAALQDDAQQLVNKLLKMDEDEIALSKFNQTQKYQNYPKQLERAANLLGPDHYMYPVLTARKLFVEGLLMHIEYRHPNRELGETILAKYRESLQLQGESPSVYFEMMMVHFFQMQEPDSADYYSHLAAEKAPAWVLPYTWMGFLYMETTVLQDLEKTRIFLELASQRDPDKSNLTLLNYWALYYSRIGDFEKGEALYKEIIQRDSSRARYFGNFAILYLESGRIKEAIVLLNKAILLDSTCHQCQSILGSAYYFNQQYPQAEKHFKISLDLDPTNLWPRVGLVQLYITSGQLKAAETESKKIFELDSMATWAYNQIGGSYYLEGMYQEAELQWQKVIQINPNDNYAHGSLGSIYVKTGRLQEAEQQYLIALEIKPKAGDFMNNLGSIYIKTGRFEEAHQILQKAMSTDQAHHKYTLVTYAFLYSQQDNYDRAFDYLEEAFQNGYDYRDRFYDLEEAGLAPLREMKEPWEALMKKYFPEQSKD